MNATRQRNVLAQFQINLNPPLVILEPETPPRRIGALKKTAFDDSKFIGPKLKIKRAKEHISQLENAWIAFKGRNPYSLVEDIDSQTGEKVFRVRVNETIPIEWSAIIGDALHNARTALDIVICDLARANGNIETGGNGFPIFKKRPKAGAIGKISGISITAKRVYSRLKAYTGGVNAYRLLHDLDILDKHNRILVVSSATMQVVLAAGLPFMHTGPQGGLGIGVSPGQDWRPIGAVGVPENFRPICPVTDNAEIYRCAFHFYQNLNVTFNIAFSETGIVDGEPVIETLHEFINLAERTIAIFERYAL